MKMLMVLVLLFACAPLAFAERLSVFNMLTCADQASVIVQGTLDAAGNIAVAKILKGDLRGKTVVSLQQGTYAFTNFQRTIKGDGPFEVVAFLTEQVQNQWRMALDMAGIVGFQQQDVFLMSDDHLRCGLLQRSPELSKATFFHDLDDSLRVSAETDALLAAPRTEATLRKLIALALAHGQPLERFSAPWQAYYLEKIASAFRDPNALQPVALPVEQMPLLQALAAAAQPRDQEILLDLARLIPLRDDAMPALAPFASRDHPKEVRVAAMGALGAINIYRAGDYLSPYITFDAPQITDVLSALCDPGGREDTLLNLKVNHALEALLPELNRRLAKPSGVDYDGTAQSIEAAMSFYLHPRLVPTLYDWAFHHNYGLSGQAYDYLVEVTGLKFPQDDKADWNAWWRKAQPHLAIEYDLHSRSGLHQYLEHYAHAEPATRAILMRLWRFEPQIDETALIDAALADENAKTILADLWHRHHLSSAAKQTILDHFFIVKLVNVPHDDKADPHHFTAQIVIKQLFPFDNDLMNERRCHVYIGDNPVIPENPWTAPRWGGEGDSNNEFAVNAAQPPKACAVLEERELDFPYSHDVVFVKRWTLGPIQLTNDIP